MRKPVPPESEAAAVIADERALLERVRALIGAREPRPGGLPSTDYDQELIALRDQLAEEKPEDLASLVEQMTRVSAIASGRRGKASAPVDAGSPYFAHLRLRAAERAASSDVLIGRRGLIDRAAGVQ
ncbi:MAG TPA: DNA helicase UvrD, partial [Polyangia bacterium]